MTKLFEVLVEALNSKERTAKVYSATIRRVHREVYGKELDNTNLKFIKSVKTYNYVKKIVNLTRRKNAATALLMGSKAIEAPGSVQERYRKVMLDADEAYRQFLLSGKRKRNFVNAEQSWKLITGLHKKPHKEIEARSLWSVGSRVTPAEYRTIMAWIYLKFLSTGVAPRRLEYTDMRLISKKDFEALEEKKDNYIVMGKRSWKIHFFLFKTVGKFGPQVLTVPGPLKAALNKIKPIAFAKNSKGFIFLTGRWKRMSRSQFSALVKWIFKTYAKKSWTQNTVRSIKISSVFTGENPLKLARDMAHGIETAALHYRQA